MPIEAPRNANIAKLAAGYLFPTIGRVRASYPAAAEREAAAVCRERRHRVNRSAGGDPLPLAQGLRGARAAASAA